MKTEANQKYGAAKMIDIFRYETEPRFCDRQSVIRTPYGVTVIKTKQ